MMAGEPQVFETATKPVVIEPLALSVIIEASERVGGKLKACLCTLLGQVLEDGTVKVSDAFVNCVRFDEDGLVETNHHEHTFQTMQKVDPRNVVVGWATTDLEFQSLELISDWARANVKVSKWIPKRKQPSPILVKVDLPTADSDLEVKAYIKGAFSSCLMKPVPVILSQAPLDLAGLADPETRLLSTASMTNAAKDVVATSRGLNSETIAILKQRLQKALEIVDGVLNGESPADPALGREMYRTLSPPIPATFDQIMKMEGQDALLAAYMSQLVKLQFMIGEKIHMLHG